ncbi:MAG TPA: tRNA (adenosine(37)-N6)-dimethylallyltransferase MiaA [Prolixibacteraceae bacterium]|nr:tRNA (adenosine(37)-N6)-dimethylallyltransferase MiaA [Prolixibacteraceae bacterium]
MQAYNLISILGATASGKTGVAAHLSKRLNGEIISADSRQVYRGMSIGTGKDIDDYAVEGQPIPYHLIDIVDAGQQYNVFEYQRDFLKAFETISERGKIPVLCGGSGMYIEAVLKGYRLINVPINEALRAQLSNKTLLELIELLKNYKNLHNTSDVDTVKRAIRAIEIEEYYLEHSEIDTTYPNINSLLIGVKFDRDSRRKRITQRLKSRLDEGMIDEVKTLLNSGLTPESLIYYGLEYKYLTQYVLGQLSYNEMFSQLETAIHQFSKRQMTWFRRMEKQGFNIHWLDGYQPMEEKIDNILKLYNQ